jgi:sulfite reductase beta subunit-like hemoprotein
MSAIEVSEAPVGRLGFARREDVDLFVEKLEAFEKGELNGDDWRTFRLLNGVYGQRQDGFQMVRAKLPGGFVTPAQLNALATIAEKHANGKAHVTTRQNVQFHFVPSADAETVLGLLAESGITTKEACGPSVRNWTCCPFAGVSRDEAFDVSPYVEALARHLLRGPFSSSLPRKLKPSIGGCCGTDCSQALINDLGFLATKRAEDGALGFRVVAGGGLSTLRRSAITVEEFIPRDEILEAADAVVRVFHRIGNRHNKAKARLKWAIDKIGIPAFLAEYRAERETIKAEGGVRLELPAQPTPPVRRPLLAQVQDADPGYSTWAEHNVRPQKQTGFSAVVIRLILGDIKPDQLRALAQLVAFGEGELRTTNEQNLVLRFVPDARLPALHRELVRVGLALGGANTLSDVTSCPGASSCKIAVTNSRGLGGHLTDHLEALLERRPDLRTTARGLDVKISGCPHGCGQHYIAGIGFQGGMRKLAGRPAPQYLVYVGGGITPAKAEFGRLIGKVPARRTGATLERLLDFYVAEGGTGPAFFANVPLDKLRSLISDLEKLSEADATAEDFIDVGESAAFEVVAGEGECAV